MRLLIPSVLVYRCRHSEPPDLKSLRQGHQIMSEPIIFENHSITIHHINGRDYLSAADISKALGFEKDDAVTQIYHRYKDEFEEGTTQTLKLSVSGNYIKNIRVFDREGAWIIAMFARTPAAAKFRKWVRKVLAAYVDGQAKIQNDPVKPVSVAPEEQPMIEKTIVAQEDVTNDLKNAYNTLFPVMDNLRAYKELWETRNILIHTSPRQALALDNVIGGLYVSLQDDIQSSYCALQDLITGKKLRAKLNADISIHHFLERVSKKTK
jgi:hypothetical protein